MPFRRANSADRDQLARLHNASSQLQPGAFMHKLGVPFFRLYYHLLLPDPNTIIFVAEDAAGSVLGFVAGCRNARLEIARLRRSRWLLLLSSLPALLRSPSLVRGLRIRMRDLANPGPDNWVAHDQPRISFWCWDPESTATRQSTLLLQTFLLDMKGTGAKVVRFEVDRVNRKVEITHRLMGARIVETLRRPDGSERLVMEHVLEGREG